MALITKSIGTTARDYSTITLWEAALGGAAGGAGNDAVGECYDDSAFDETVTIDDATPDSILLTVAAGERHGGISAAGVTWSGSAFEGACVVGVPDVTVEWFVITDSGNGNDAALVASAAIPSASNGIVIQNNVVELGTGLDVGIKTDGNSGPHDIQNNIVYRAAGSNGEGITGSTQATNILNNTVFNNFDTGIDPGAANTTKNCISVDNTTDFDSDGTQDYNMASDDSDSGANSIGADDGVVTANQFVSTVGGSEDLHLKSGADAIDAADELGTTPTGVNIDIDGVDRTVINNWDIGAHDFLGAPPAGNRRRRLLLGAPA